MKLRDCHDFKKNIAFSSVSNTKVICEDQALK